MLRDVIIEETRRPVSFEEWPSVVFDCEEADDGTESHLKELPELGPPSSRRLRDALSHRFNLNGQLFAHVMSERSQLGTFAAHRLPVEWVSFVFFEHLLG